MEPIHARELIERQLSVAQNETGTLYLPMFRQLIDALEREAWDRGVDFASNLAASDRDRYSELLLQVVSTIRGKDRADGMIRFAVYPDPVIYDWMPALDQRGGGEI